MKRLLLAIVILSALAQAAWAQFQLMTPERLAAYRRLIPKIEEAALARGEVSYNVALHDANAILYTDVEMPRAYQHGGTFHSTLYNISGDPSDRGLPHGRGGNANVDFPWRVPGGTDAAEGNTTSFKIMRLPLASNGVPWPVVVYRQTLPNGPLGPGGSTKWMFPIGTEFYEVLLIRDSKGLHYPFEVRVRTREPDYWNVDILRPFPMNEDFVKRIREVAPTWAQTVSAPRKTYLDMLWDGKNRTRSGFMPTVALVDYVPKLPEDVTAKLLRTTEFKSALGAPWKKTSVATAFTPMGDQSFGIVPYGYTGTFLGGDHVSCRRCHDSTLVAARTFDRGRGWYGAVRGSADANVSFNPIALSSISYNGSRLPVRLRQSLVSAGIVANYDQRIHPRSRYQLLSRQEKLIQ